MFFIVNMKKIIKKYKVNFLDNFKNLLHIFTQHDVPTSSIFFINHIYPLSNITFIAFKNS